MDRMAGTDIRDIDKWAGDTVTVRIDAHVDHERFHNTTVWLEVSRPSGQSILEQAERVDADSITASFTTDEEGEHICNWVFQWPAPPARREVYSAGTVNIADLPHPDWSLDDVNIWLTAKALRRMKPGE